MIRTMLLFTLFWAAVPVYAEWAHETPGSTVLLDHDFSEILGPGMSNPYKAGEIIKDDTAPVSPGGVYKSSLAVGANNGGSELHWNSPVKYPELYVAVVWRTNPEFEGRPVGNKLFFVRGPANNGVFLTTVLNNGEGALLFGHNSSTHDNSHIWSADLGLVGMPNMSSGTVTVGTWHTIETYIKKSTTSTSQDGTVRWWIDGVLAGDFTTANYGEEGLDEWVWTETWDGMVKPVPTVEWVHLLDHLHISVPK